MHKQLQKACNLLYHTDTIRSDNTFSIILHVEKVASPVTLLQTSTVNLCFSVLVRFSTVVERKRLHRL